MIKATSHINHPQPNPPDNSLLQGTGEIRAMKQMSKKEMVFKNQAAKNSPEKTKGWMYPKKWPPYLKLEIEFR